MLACLKSYPEDVKALLAEASPEGINFWKLLDHDELERENWVHEKVALMGDVAHTFLPHQGQGGAQAIEDAAALGALLPFGTRISDIPKRLELCVQARYDRATMIQDFTRQAAFKTSRGKHGVFQVNFTHDAFDNTHGLLLREMNKWAKYRRMPLSFDPAPSPRQDLNSSPRALGKHAYKTSYVTFRTHKSYLSTLLPSDEFEISTKGSWVSATFSVSKLGNLTWLGDRGYSFFGIYIHDVVTEIQGDFLPVLFENMANPIITGREELNFLKVFATLDERSTSTSSYQLSDGWEGTEFCQIILEDLVKTPDSEPVLQTLILTASASTSMNENGTVEILNCFSSPALPLQAGEKRWKAGKADIKFTDLEGRELDNAFPTLANVVTGLRGIRVVEVLSSGVQASV